MKSLMTFKPSSQKKKSHCVFVICSVQDPHLTLLLQLLQNYYSMFGDIEKAACFYLNSVAEPMQLVGPSLCASTISLPIKDRCEPAITQCIYWNPLSWYTHVHYYWLLQVLYDAVCVQNLILMVTEYICVIYVVSTKSDLIYSLCIVLRLFKQFLVDVFSPKHDKCHFVYPVMYRLCCLLCSHRRI